MNKISTAFILTVFFLFSCSSSDKGKPLGDSSSSSSSSPKLVNKPFKQGVINMGIFNNDVDLGKFIEKINFSKPDVKQQFEKLLKNDQESKAIFELIQNAGNQNPLAALAMTLNIAECTYNIKNDVVLGKVRGFGWTMDNFHNKGEDQASLYIETLVQTNQIPDQDKKIYSLYQPSKKIGAGAINNVDFNLYKREIQATKQNVSGYDCDVIVYTPKNIATKTPVKLNKLVVYTSPLFDNTINFAHPYYLEEKSGILRLDIYLIDNTTPTLVMKPKSIREQTLTSQDLISRTSTPVYAATDVSWAFKSLTIMMSGWGVLKDAE